MLSNLDFEDEEDLVRALGHQDFARLLGAMEKAPSSADPVEAMRQLGRAWVDLRIAPVSH